MKKRGVVANIRNPAATAGRLILSSGVLQAAYNVPNPGRKRLSKIIFVNGLSQELS
jgi:hypothetical protein